MSMQWHFEQRHFEGEGGIGILQLRGYLGESVLDQLTGAVDWALSRGDGPVIVDVTHLLGCGQQGADALWAAAHRIAGSGRAVAISGVGTDLQLQSVRYHSERRGPVSVHEDLTGALAMVLARH